MQRIWSETLTSQFSERSPELPGTAVPAKRDTLAQMVIRHESFRRLCRVRELLIEVHDETRLISELADEVGISSFHLIRQFESLFGLTPHQFRIQSRLDRAKVLLANGQYSVTEVCMEIGFSSLGSFSDLFARRIGMSPSAYQRRARKLVTIPGSFPQILFPGCLSMMALLPASAFRNFQEARLDASH